MERINVKDAMIVVAIGNPKFCKNIPPRKGPITSPMEYMQDQTPATRLYVARESSHPPSLKDNKNNAGKLYDFYSYIAFVRTPGNVGSNARATATPRIVKATKSNQRALKKHFIKQYVYMFRNYTNSISLANFLFMIKSSLPAQKRY